LDAADVPSAEEWKGRPSGQPPKTWPKEEWIKLTEGIKLATGWTQCVQSSQETPSKQDHQDFLLFFQQQWWTGNVEQSHHFNVLLLLNKKFFFPK